VEDVTDVIEECGPALSAFAAGGGRSAYRIVRNDVSGDCEGDAGQFVGIGHDGPGRLGHVQAPAGTEKHASQDHGQHDSSRDRQDAGSALPAPALPCGQADTRRRQVQ
jgi:hypothetical protein